MNITFLNETKDFLLNENENFKWGGRKGEGGGGGA